MTKKWIAINVLLLAIAGLLGRQLYVSILAFNAKSDLSKIQPVRNIRQNVGQENPLPALAPPKPYLPGEFSMIPEQNLFSESRGKEDTTEVAAPPPIPPLTQKPILIGVTIVDDQKRALIIDPGGSPQDKTRRTQVKRIGDVYRGYTITDISPDRMVLESGPRREIIPLHEGTKRSKEGKTPILSTRVISFGGGASSGGTRVGSGSGGAPARTTTVAVGSSPSPAAVGQPAAIQPPTGQPRTGSSPQIPQTQRQTVPRTDSQGRQIIRTPFGDVLRPNRN